MVNDEIKREKVRDGLASIFGLRLQALIRYDNPDFTQQIVDHFLQRMDQLSSEEQDNHHQSFLVLDNIYKLLYFDNHADDLEYRDLAIDSANNAIKELYPYVETLYTHLCKNYVSKAELKKCRNDVRKAVGNKFKTCMKKIENASYDRQGIYDQLNHMTLNRNTSFHAHKDGDSKKYKGFQILGGYDVLMNCLLYTFYHMVFTNLYQPYRL